MISFIKGQESTVSRKIVSCVITISFLSNMIVPASVSAQSAPLAALAGLNLPVPGTMTTVSPGFTPPLMRGMSIFPDNPLQFNFIMDDGDQDLTGASQKEEYEKLIKYFLASLTIPDQDMWVNLSPNEADRIIPDDLALTEMGRDMLSQDYVLKQLAASMPYPESNLGQRFWDRVYEKAQEQYGTTDIPVSTFNKIWVIPQKAVVFEQNGSAFVAESSLKVMLEEDYLTMQKSLDQETQTRRLPQPEAEELSKLSSEVVRHVLLPEIEKEINTGENFAPLRQIYHSMILAAWYKRTLRNSLLGQVYIGQAKVKGIDVEDKAFKQQIYARYLSALKKGAYDYIKKDIDPVTQQLKMKRYFSGGKDLSMLPQNLQVIRAPERLSPGTVKNLAVLAAKVPKVATVNFVENLGEKDAQQVAPALPAADQAMIGEDKMAINLKRRYVDSFSDRYQVRDDENIRKIVDLLSVDELVRLSEWLGGSYIIDIVSGNEFFRALEQELSSGDRELAVFLDDVAWLDEALGQTGLSSHDARRVLTNALKEDLVVEMNEKVRSVTENVNAFEDLDEEDRIKVLELLILNPEDPIARMDAFLSKDLDWARENLSGLHKLLAEELQNSNLRSMFFLTTIALPGMAQRGARLKELLGDGFLPYAIRGVENIESDLLKALHFAPLDYPYKGKKGTIAEIRDGLAKIPPGTTDEFLEDYLDDLKVAVTMALAKEKGLSKEAQALLKEMIDDKETRVPVHVRGMKTNQEFLSELAGAGFISGPDYNIEYFAGADRAMLDSVNKDRVVTAKERLLAEIEQLKGSGELKVLADRPGLQRAVDDLLLTFGIIGELTDISIETFLKGGAVEDLSSDGTTAKRLKKAANVDASMLSGVKIQLDKIKRLVDDAYSHAGELSWDSSFLYDPIKIQTAQKILAAQGRTLEEYLTDIAKEAEKVDEVTPPLVRGLSSLLYDPVFVQSFYKLQVNEFSTRLYPVLIYTDLEDMTKRAEIMPLDDLLTVVSVAGKQWGSVLVTLRALEEEVFNISQGKQIVSEFDQTRKYLAKQAAIPAGNIIKEVITSKTTNEMKDELLEMIKSSLSAGHITPEQIEALSAMARQTIRDMEEESQLVKMEFGAITLLVNAWEKEVVADDKGLKPVVLTRMLEKLKSPAWQEEVLQALENGEKELPEFYKSLTRVNKDYLENLEWLLQPERVRQVFDLSKGEELVDIMMDLSRFDSKEDLSDDPVGTETRIMAIINGGFGEEADRIIETLTDLEKLNRTDGFKQLLLDTVNQYQSMELLGRLKYIKALATNNSRIDEQIDATRKVLGLKSRSTGVTIDEAFGVTDIVPSANDESGADLTPVLALQMLPLLLALRGDINFPVSEDFLINRMTDYSLTKDQAEKALFMLIENGHLKRDQDVPTVLILTAEGRRAKDRAMTGVDVIMSVLNRYKKKIKTPDDILRSRAGLLLGTTNQGAGITFNEVLKSPLITELDADHSIKQAVAYLITEKLNARDAAMTADVAKEYTVPLKRGVTAHVRRDKDERLFRLQDDEWLPLEDTQPQEDITPIRIAVSQQIAAQRGRDLAMLLDGSQGDKRVDLTAESARQWPATPLETFAQNTYEEVVGLLRPGATNTHLTKEILALRSGGLIRENAAVKKQHVENIMKLLEERGDASPQGLNELRVLDETLRHVVDQAMIVSDEQRVFFNQNLRIISTEGVRFLFEIKPGANVSLKEIAQELFLPISEVAPINEAFRDEIFDITRRLDAGENIILPKNSITETLVAEDKMGDFKVSGLPPAEDGSFRAGDVLGHYLEGRGFPKIGDLAMLDTEQKLALWEKALGIDEKDIPDDVQKIADALAWDLGNHEHLNLIYRTRSLMKDLKDKEAEVLLEKLKISSLYNREKRTIAKLELLVDSLKEAKIPSSGRVIAKVAQANDVEGFSSDLIDVLNTKGFIDLSKDESGVFFNLIVFASEDPEAQIKNYVKKDPAWWSNLIAEKEHKLQQATLDSDLSASIFRSLVTLPDIERRGARLNTVLNAIEKTGSISYDLSRDILEAFHFAPLDYPYRDTLNYIKESLKILQPEGKIEFLEGVARDETVNVAVALAEEKRLSKEAQGVLKWLVEQEVDKLREEPIATMVKQVEDKNPQLWMDLIEAGFLVLNKDERSYGVSPFAGADKAVTTKETPDDIVARASKLSVKARALLPLAMQYKEPFFRYTAWQQADSVPEKAIDELKQAGFMREDPDNGFLMFTAAASKAVAELFKDLAMTAKKVGPVDALLRSGIIKSTAPGSERMFEITEKGRLAEGFDPLTFLVYGLIEEGLYKKAGDLYSSSIVRKRLEELAIPAGPARIRAVDEALGTLLHAEYIKIIPQTGEGYQLSKLSPDEAMLAPKESQVVALYYTGKLNEGPVTAVSLFARSDLSWQNLEEVQATLRGLLAKGLMDKPVESNGFFFTDNFSVNDRSLALWSSDLFKTNVDYKVEDTDRIPWLVWEDAQGETYKQQALEEILDQLVVLGKMQVEESPVFGGKVWRVKDPDNAIVEDQAMTNKEIREAALAIRNKEEVEYTFTGDEIVKVLEKIHLLDFSAMPTLAEAGSESYFTARMMEETTMVYDKAEGEFWAVHHMLDRVKENGTALVYRKRRLSFDRGLGGPDVVPLETRVNIVTDDLLENKKIVYQEDVIKELGKYGYSDKVEMRNEVRDRLSKQAQEPQVMRWGPDGIAQFTSVQRIILQILNQSKALYSSFTPDDILNAGKKNGGWDIVDELVGQLREAAAQTTTRVEALIVAESNDLVDLGVAAKVEGSTYQLTPKSVENILLDQAMVTLEDKVTAVLIDLAASRPGIFFLEGHTQGIEEMVRAVLEKTDPKKAVADFMKEWMKIVAHRTVFEDVAKKLQESLSSDLAMLEHAGELILLRIKLEDGRISREQLLSIYLKDMHEAGKPMARSLVESYVENLLKKESIKKVDEGEEVFYELTEEGDRKVVDFAMRASNDVEIIKKAIMQMGPALNKKYVDGPNLKGIMYELRNNDLHPPEWLLKEAVDSLMSENRIHPTELGGFEFKPDRKKDGDNAMTARQKEKVRAALKELIKDRVLRAVNPAQQIEQVVSGLDFNVQAKSILTTLVAAGLQFNADKTELVIDTFQRALTTDQAMLAEDDDLARMYDRFILEALKDSDGLVSGAIQDKVFANAQTDLSNDEVTERLISLEGRGLVTRLDDEVRITGQGELALEDLAMTAEERISVFLPPVLGISERIDVKTINGETRVRQLGEWVLIEESRYAGEASFIEEKVKAYTPKMLAIDGKDEAMTAKRVVLESMIEAVGPSLGEMYPEGISNEEMAQLLGSRGWSGRPEWVGTALESLVAEEVYQRNADGKAFFTGRDRAALAERPGGIDFNSELLDLQIRRDGNGVPLPLPQQAIEAMNIQGFYPVIINIAPALNLPMLMGLNTENDAESGNTTETNLSWHMTDEWFIKPTELLAQEA